MILLLCYVIFTTHSTLKQSSMIRWCCCITIEAVVVASGRVATTLTGAGAGNPAGLLGDTKASGAANAMPSSRNESTKILCIIL